jgi:hypothetical protein
MDDLVQAAAAYATLRVAALRPPPDTELRRALGPGMSVQDKPAAALLCSPAGTGKMRRIAALVADEPPACAWLVVVLDTDTVDELLLRAVLFDRIECARRVDVVIGAHLAWARAFVDAWRAATDVGVWRPSVGTVDRACAEELLRASRACGAEIRAWAARLVAMAPDAAAAWLAAHGAPFVPNTVLVLHNVWPRVRADAYHGAFRALVEPRGRHVSFAVVDDTASFDDMLRLFHTGLRGQPECIAPRAVAPPAAEPPAVRPVRRARPRAAAVRLRRVPPRRARRRSRDVWVTPPSYLRFK